MSTMQAKANISIQPFKVEKKTPGGIYRATDVKQQRKPLPVFQVQGLVNQSPDTYFLAAPVSQVSAS